MMAGYVYDLAQLIHQQKLAPVDHRRPFARRQHRPALCGLYPENVVEAGRHRGSRPVAEDACANAVEEAFRRAHARWIEEQRALSGRLPRRYATIEDASEAHAGGEQAPVARAGAASHAARRQPERGRHLQLEVRQLRALLAALRHAAWPTWKSYGRASPVRRCWSTARKAGLPIRPRTAGCGTSNARRSSPFERAGHWVHHDRPRGFLETVQPFLAGHPVPADQLGGKTWSDPSVAASTRRGSR